MTDDLLALAAWLAEAGVVDVARESTGVYGTPVFNRREGQLAVIRVNAQPITPVPGRQTEVKDCQWIAPLLQSGRRRPRYLPPRPIRALRALRRPRTQLIRQRAPLRNRIPKVLGDAPRKRAGVASEIRGVSCHPLSVALIAGEPAPARLAQRAKRRRRAQIPPRTRARHGPVRDHQRFPRHALRQPVNSLAGWLEQRDGRIAALTAPWAAASQRRVTIPGINRQAAAGRVAEGGVDRGACPPAGHRCSWTGRAPGNHRSAGTRPRGRTSKAHRWRRPLLIPVAGAARRSKGTRCEATDRRWVKRRGRTRAVVGLGHQVLTISDAVLTDHVVSPARWRPEPGA